MKKISIKPHDTQTNVKSSRLNSNSIGRRMKLPRIPDVYRRMKALFSESWPAASRLIFWCSVAIYTMIHSPDIASFMIHRTILPFLVWHKSSVQNQRVPLMCPDVKEGSEKYTVFPVLDCSRQIYVSCKRMAKDMYLEWRCIHSATPI